MATQNVTHAAHGTLTASTVEIINFADPVYLVIVRNRGATDLYYNVKGGGATATDPTVGNDSYIVTAGGTISISRPVNQAVSQVKLFSTAGVAYSVEGF